MIKLLEELDKDSAEAIRRIELKEELIKWPLDAVTLYDISGNESKHYIGTDGYLAGIEGEFIRWGDVGSKGQQRGTAKYLALKDVNRIYSTPIGIAVLTFDPWPPPEPRRCGFKERKRQQGLLTTISQTKPGADIQIWHSEAREAHRNGQSVNDIVQGQHTYRSCLLSHLVHGDDWSKCLEPLVSIEYADLQPERNLLLLYLFQGERRLSAHG